MTNSRLLALLGLCALPLALQAADFRMYAGTYTRGESKGIYAYDFESSSGKFSALGLVAETPNPSFLVEHPNHRYLYAANEGAGPSGDTVSAFAIDLKTGKLALLNSVSSKGEAPCHLAIDKTGRWLVAANYTSGTVAVMPLMADGKVGEAVAVKQHEGSGPDARRQKGPHAHEAVFSPDNRFLLVADLGLDQVMVYRFDAAKGTITPNDPPSGKVAPGAGVRHLVFHPKGSVVYAINEMGSTVTAFRYDREKGTLTEFQTVTTLPQGFTGTSSTAEIGINRAGTVLYGSNRGHNSVAVFSIDPAKFTLTPAGHTSTQGKTPRHFTLDPTGKWLIAENQDGGGIVLFRVDQKTGQLTPEGQPLTDAPFPVCVVFVPVS